MSLNLKKTKAFRVVCTAGIFIVGANDTTEITAKLKAQSVEIDGLSSIEYLGSVKLIDSRATFENGNIKDNTGAATPEDYIIISEMDGEMCYAPSNDKNFLVELLSQYKDVLRLESPMDKEGSDKEKVFILP